MTMTYRAGGDANTHTLFQGDRWIAAIQFNGELLVEAQDELLRRFAGAPIEAVPSVLNDPQAIAAILAGLRLLQRQDVLPKDVEAIFTDCGALPHLGEGDIDTLCERLTFEPG